MSRRNNKRGSSKVVWVIIGIFLFALVVFPYFGSNFRYLITSSLLPLRTIGQFSFLFGAILVFGGLIIKRSKVILWGIVLLVIGMFLGDPVDFLSFFTGGSPSRGYHFLS